MLINRIEMFKESAKIEGKYDELKFRSILSENYINFCNFCETLENNYTNFNKINCNINEEKKIIKFNVDIDNSSDEYLYNY